MGKVHDQDYIANNVSEQVHNDQDSNKDISYAELYRMVIETSDLTEVIKSYFDPTDGYGCVNF